MRIVGVIRKIDGLGRLVIPKEFRDVLEIHTQEAVEITLTTTGLFVKKIRSSCAICGETDNLTELNNRFICNACLKKTQNLSSPR